MLTAMIIAGLVGALASVSRLTMTAHRREHETARNASRALVGELRAAIDAIDVALRNEDYRWLCLPPESRDRLDAIWHHYSEMLWRAGRHEQWQIVNDAIWATRPSYELALAGSPKAQQRSLTLRREQIAAAALVLEDPDPPLR